MSGGSKQKYKHFPINNAQEACIVLGSLISAVTIHLEKYKEYCLEAEALLESSEEEFIDAKLYDDINDKILFRQHEMLKLIADHQDSSFSYKSIHQLLMKHGYITSKMPDDVIMILSDLLDIRNWTFHNPQSLMTAAKEVAEKNIPESLKSTIHVTAQLNPVIIEKITRYEIIVLDSLTYHMSKRITQFERILEKMKEDYQEIYDTIKNTPFFKTENGLSNKVQYREINTVLRLFDHHSDIARISMAIQKSKYDGHQ